MSTCISRAGEYSSHETTPGNYICELCGVLDEAAMFTEIERLRARDATAVRLVGLLRSQVHRLWAYHDWADGHDCSAPKPDDGMEFARIVITRVLTEDGDDVHNVEATAGMSLIEALGMLRLAESTVLEFPPGEDDGEDD